MTREKISKRYDLNEYGIITSPGSFESEMYYAVYYWEQALQGLSDEEIFEDDTEVSIFYLTDKDKKMFPELEDDDILEIWQNEQGFINCRSFKK